MRTKSFAPGDFLKALAEGSLVEPLILVGVVKPDPSDYQAFQFSQGGLCGPWLKVPGEAVESVEFLRLVPCKDHEHPFVQLQLKAPPKDNVLAVFFSGLARQTVLPDLLPRAGIPRGSAAKSSVVRASHGPGNGPIIRPGVGQSPLAVSSFGWTFPRAVVSSGIFEEETFTIDENGHYTENYDVHCSTSLPDYCWFQETVTIEDENHGFIAEWSWTYPPDGTVMSPGNDSGRKTKAGFIQELKNRYWEIRHERANQVFHCSGPFC